MPQYEMNLKEYLNQLQGVNKIEKIVEVAIKLTSIFKYTHCAKRTFNDLKLENIMVDTQGNMEADPKVFLIDFGFAQKYVKKDGKQHISDKEVVQVFQGNMVFASARQMAFLMTSRKDDLVSLFYMLIFMLNDRNLWVGTKDPCSGASGVNQIFQAIQEWKTKNDLCTIAELFCQEFAFPLKGKHSGHDEHIKSFCLNLCMFADEIQKIGFADKPAYSKMKNHLTECKKACQKLGKI